MCKSAENDGDALDWQNIRAEIRTRWRESGVTPRELLRLILTMNEEGLALNRLATCRLLLVHICYICVGTHKGIIMLGYLRVKLYDVNKKCF